MKFLSIVLIEVENVENGLKKSVVRSANTEIAAYIWCFMHGRIQLIIAIKFLNVTLPIFDIRDNYIDIWQFLTRKDKEQLSNSLIGFHFAKWR